MYSHSPIRPKARPFRSVQSSSGRTHTSHLPQASRPGRSLAHHVHSRCLSFSEFSPRCSMMRVEIGTVWETAEWYKRRSVHGIAHCANTLDTARQEIIL